MSYRNPKYIDTSVQGSFDKLQNTINANVATMAKNQKEQKEKDEAEKNRQILAGTNQSQATITKNANYNTVGNQVTTGKVGNYFSGYPARAAELATELAKTPKPEKNRTQEKTQNQQRKSFRLKRDQAASELK